jgi:hypothetical protein
MLFGCVTGVAAIPIGLLCFVNFEADFDIIFYFVVYGVILASAISGFVIGVTAMLGFYVLLNWIHNRDSKATGIK